MGGQEVITVSVSVIPQEEESPNNITKFWGKFVPTLTTDYSTVIHTSD